MNLVNVHFEKERERKMKKQEDISIPGQINLFEFLTNSFEKLSTETIEIKEVVNVKTYSDFSIKSTYRDIFLIINMLDDYVEVLKKKEDRNYYTDYMIKQFERISLELSEQIELDKEKMYKRCQHKLNKQDNVGEDAMVLTGLGKES